MPRTKLMCAALKGDVDEVREHLHEVRQSDEYGKTALMLALTHRHVECAMVLAPFEVARQDGFNWSALHYAAKYNVPDVIPILLPWEAKNLDNTGQTALMRAAFNGNLECARLLLPEAGMQLAQDDIYGNPAGTTALVLGIRYNQLAVVQLLLPYEGAIHNQSYQMALHHAKANRYTEVLALLGSSSEGRTRVSPPPIPSRPEPYPPDLLAAAERGDVTAVKKCLLQAGRRTVARQTALMLAAQRGHVDCVRVLARREAKLFDKNGWTALMHAAHHDQVGCARLLIMEAGLQSHVRVGSLEEGVTALMIAAYHGHFDIVELLWQYECGIVDAWGDRAFAYAQKDHPTLKRRDKKILDFLGPETGHVPMHRSPPSIDSVLGFMEDDKVLPVQPSEEFSRSIGVVGSIAHSPNTSSSQIQVKRPFLASDSKAPPTHTSSSYGPANSIRAPIILVASTEPDKEVSPLPHQTSPSRRQLTDAHGATSDQDRPNQTAEEVMQLRTLVSTLQKSEKELKEQLARANTEIARLTDICEQLQQDAPVGKKVPDLIQAAIVGDLSRARMCISQARTRDKSGRTALMHAAEYGQADLVKVLRPLEARLRDMKGWTALMYAAVHGHKECVTLLLLEADLVNEDGEKARDVYALSGGEDSEITELLRKDPRFTYLPVGLGCKITGRLGYRNSVVYSVYSETLGNCALKIVLYFGNDPELLERRLDGLLSLQKHVHPNLLRYHVVHNDTDDDSVYLIMDMCVEALLEQLRARRSQRAEYSNDEVLRYLQDIAAGLKYLHDKGTLHKDLCPDNVLINSDGTCILANTGIVRDSNKSGVYATNELGVCRAPEVDRKSTNCTPASDIWSLGIIAYRLCTGAYPPFDFDSENLVALNDRPERLQTLIKRMLSKDPSTRPSIQEVSQHLTDLTATSYSHQHIKHLFHERDTALSELRAARRQISILERSLGSQALDHEPRASK
ncbi:Kinase, NEK [Giardia muris]|uniref:Kinase, NEK n=1 Tax=Giardia muris TaxID=5742 RepID=A0A4Z1SLR4_GIAMU|nr:Kinase, NEK [Giardia muris]|eukprot:TNJ26480.1 Kinase, NEK [Giardia muris]